MNHILRRNKSNLDLINRRGIKQIILFKNHIDLFTKILVILNKLFINKLRELSSNILKKLFLSGTKTKLAALLVKNDLDDFKKLMDPSEIGGTPFLGISKPVIKAHGSSDARAIYNAVRQARDFAASGFIQDIEANIEYMKVTTSSEKA